MNKLFVCLLSACVLFSCVPLRAMDFVRLPLPKLLIVEDRFPVYTRDFVNEEIRALVTSGKFDVSLYSEKEITDPSQLAKLPEWMKSFPCLDFTIMPKNLDEYSIILAEWGHMGEKIAQRKHEGKYNGILATRFRGSPEERIGRPDENCYIYLKQYGDLYLPNCGFFQNELVNKFAFDAERFTVHYSAVDVDAIKRMVAEYTLLPRGSIEEGVIISSCARLEPKKGLGIAMAAVARFCQNNKNINLKYIIIGEGPQRAELEAQREKLGLVDIVSLVGAKSKKEVIEQFVKSHIVLAPSYTPEDGDVEGIMNVFKEAGLAEAIAVATDHAGAPELIEHNRTGVIARQNDVEDLANTLTYAIAHAHLWPQWRENLKREVEERFDGAKVHPQLIEILTKALATKNEQK